MLTREMLERKFDFFGDLNTTEYKYDAAGRRTKKIVIDHLDASKSFERRYIFDGNERLADYDHDNEVLAVHTHSGLRTDDTLSSQITTEGRTAGLAQASGTFFYLKDSLGTITDVVDVNGNLIQHYVYSSFGKILKITDQAEQETTAPILKPEYTFTNREFDEETGLYYYRARYYEAGMGRFLQEDPFKGIIESPISLLNRYGYSRNSPLNYIDSDGRNPFLAIAIGAIIGATLGALDALINNKDFASSVTQGAMVGAIIGGLYLTGNGIAASTIIIKSLLQAAITKKGSFLSNFNEYTYENTTKSAVGVAFIGVAQADFGLSDFASGILAAFGAILTFKEINDQSCDKDVASDFAQENLCLVK